MRIRFMLVFSALLILASIMIGCTKPAAPVAAPAEDVASLYKSKPITIIVNGAAGGTTDYCGRLFASFWSQMTGGPTPEVKVMSGGGGLEGDNFIYGNAAPDGFTMGITTHSADFAGPLITGAAGVKYDARELGFIGAFGFSPYAMFLGVDSKYKTINDLKAGKGIVFGGTGAGGAAQMGVALAIDTLNLDAKINLGYENNELALSLQRGEIQGFCNSASSGNDYVRNKQAAPAWVYANSQSGWLPGTPTFAEITKMTPDQAIVNQFIIELGGWKSMFVPPKTPQNRLTFLRQTFDKMMALPALIEQAKPKLPVFEKPLTGQELATNLENLTNLSADKKAAVQTIIKKYIK